MNLSNSGGDLWIRTDLWGLLDAGWQALFKKEEKCFDGAVSSSGFGHSFSALSPAFPGASQNGGLRLAAL
jgi:hypothetical protein